jgi:hypothetical protein
MNAHTTNRLARAYFVLSVAFLAAEFFFGYRNDPSSLLGSIFGELVILAFAVVSFLITSRRPENLVGWAIAIGTLLTAAADFGLEYAVYGLVTAPGSVPIPIWVGILAGCFRSVGFILILYVVLLLFPDGHLPSPRWRPVAWLLVVSALVQALDSLFSPDFSDIDSRLAPFSKPTGNILPNFAGDIFGGLTLLCWGASVLACVAALVVRFRRSSGDERQQLKWLTYSSFLSGAILVLIYVGVALNLSIVNTMGGYLFDLALLPIPVAVGIAILKYRLYDIDIIVNRTLVYGSLTAVLAVIYWGSVVGLQEVLRPLVGEGNDLAVVASTLLTAGLFLPLRSRIQSFIDRRFYRRKYDAARTLEAFSAAMRDEVDLATLADHLVAVVEETIQPAHTSLWLKTDKKEKVA